MNKKTETGYNFDLIPCAVYSRVSTDEQAKDSHYSLDNQEGQCLDVIRSNLSKGWVHRISLRDEGYSGALHTRPGLQRILELAKSGDVKMVVVYMRDRLFRDRGLAISVENFFDIHGVQIYSVKEGLANSTDSGKLVTGIIDGFSSYERSVTRTRVRDACRLGAKRGEWKGGVPPFGYSYEKGSKTLTVDEKEALIVKYIYYQIADGVSVSEIIKELRRLKTYGRYYKQRSLKR
jgi:site-specific DNA recombinase